MTQLLSRDGGERVGKNTSFSKSRDLKGMRYDVMKKTFDELILNPLIWMIP